MSPSSAPSGIEQSREEVMPIKAANAVPSMGVPGAVHHPPSSTREAPPGKSIPSIAPARFLAGVPRRDEARLTLPMCRKGVPNDDGV